MKRHLLLLAIAIFGMIGAAKAQEPVTSFFEDFEDGTLGVMTALDGDFDGINWMNSSTLQAQGDGHNGSLRYAYSESWTTVMRPGLTPDNFLVTPLITATETSVFTFFACSDWYAYTGEHYGVAISTKSNTEPTDFTTIAEWTLTDKSRDNDQGPWHEHNIDLSEYAGQNIYVAIRHFECSNIYRIDVDDISVTTEEGGCDAPANFNGELNNATVTLGWNAAGNAIGYNVYRSTTGDNYEIITNVTETNYGETVTENGDYYYQVTAVYDNGCESAPATTAEGDDFLMFTVSGLGIAENNINVNLYPNPSDGAFTVNCQGMTRVTVCGLCGETVIDVTTTADSYVISDLDTGIYFVRIETAKGSTTQKIVRL
ncbi:MAG: choice-of-anchor J domain-containing protein [Bacteroidales bacterium]|nr:choice-of-anchor J domain-containing protein [Bacteroidales bacterium]